MSGRVFLAPRGSRHAAAVHVAQHPLGDVDLVRQRLDRVRVECDQPFEARDQGDPFRLTPQLVPVAVGRGRLEPFRERLEGVLVYRPDVLGWRGGQGQNGWRLRHRHAAGGEGATIYQLSVISYEAVLNGEHRSYANLA